MPLIWTTRYPASGATCTPAPDTLLPLSPFPLLRQCSSAARDSIYSLTPSFSVPITVFPSFSLLHITQCSSAARDFIVSCLHKDAAERPTAQQLLSHAWIRTYAAAAAPLH